MNLNLIKEKETLNKGVNIYLYLSDVSGQWAAYGPSAYALRLYVKSNGYDSLRAYSSELNMPCTVVSYKTVKSLRNMLKITDEKEMEMVALEVEEEFEFDKFLMWTSKLHKENELGEHTISIKTLVSDKVPKGVFIEDGMSSFARYVKRILDFLLAVITLIVFLPLMLICYIAIKMDDGGPYSHYADGILDVKYSKDKLAEMMLLDGCFLL